MARPKRQTLAVRQFLGMNDSDPEISLLPDQARVLENADIITGGIGKRRAGFGTLPTDGDPPQGEVGTIIAIYKHAPTGNNALAELWVAVRRTATTTLHRLVGGAVWSEFALVDEGPLTPSVVFATFNQKLFLAYPSLVNRLHVWDGVSIRRVGMAPPAAAPILASAGAGALAFTRFYRVRFRTTVGSPQSVLLSEPSPSASITIAASSGVNISRPALVDGNEQAWHIDHADSAGGPWFEFAQVAIGTLVFLDANATIATTSPSREVGLFALPPSCKYLSVYRTQLLMAGTWATTTDGNGQTVPKNNRVWFTRPLGSLDFSDDESVPDTFTAKFWADLSQDGDEISGLSYPMEGIPYALKVRQVWGLVATDDLTAPFRTVRITDAVGCIDARTLVIGEDEQGNPALYFNSIRGPYRIGRAGLQYIGRDLALSPEPLQLAATRLALWVPELRQVWFVAEFTSVIYKFNVQYGRAEHGEVRYGWTRDRLANATSPTPPLIVALGLFQPPFGGLSAIQPEEPVIGGSMPQGGNPSLTWLWQRDRLLQTDDTNLYRGFTTTPSYTLGDLLSNVVIYPPRIYTDATQTAEQYTLQCRVVPNLGGPPQTGEQTALVTLGITPLSLGRIGTFEGIAWSDAETYQFTIGDSGPVDQSWVMTAFMVPWQTAEEAE